MTSLNRKKTSEKIKIFKGFFTGLTDVYGTYDSVSGRTSQVKEPVTDSVFLAHLMGIQPYGVYLLVKDRTCAIAVDFDMENRMTPMEFTSQARHYGITSYIERSKSKGYHVWIFFSRGGVLAHKARMVVRHILDEIDAPDTEIFPKQDRLNKNVRYGNFINAPLFGKLVPKGRTVFVDPGTFKPYPDQWELLQSVHRINETTLDDIIELNDLSPGSLHPSQDSGNENPATSQHSLPCCAQKMLKNGVSRFQRVSCFRLAVHLKRLGLPFDVAVAALKTWASKNRPKIEGGIITEQEIMAQISYAYSKNYRGYGCGSEAVSPFCSPECPLNKLKKEATPDRQSHYQQEASHG